MPRRRGRAAAIDTGELDLIASTDASTLIVEAMQLGVVAGPCVDA